MDRLHIGLIGAGGMGSAHARSLTAVGELWLAAVADVNVAMAQTLADAAGATAHADYRELLARPDIPAVLIATPGHLHSRMALDALRAGKHVLLEKPMAFTAAECDQLIMEAESRALKLTVGQQLRLMPLYVRVRELAADFGPALSLHVVRVGDMGRRGARERPSWRLDRSQFGGLLFEVNVHELDLMGSIAGEVAEVQASVANFSQPTYELAETCLVTLRFASGAIGQLYASGTSVLSAQHGSIACRDGAVRYDHASSTVGYARRGTAAVEERVESKFGEGLTRLHRSFARWVLHDEPPDVTSRDGRRACAAAEAAYLAAQRRAAVNVPAPP